MAEYFAIDGNQVIAGEIEISGAKNAVLPILFAAIHGTDQITLHNVPNLSDVDVTLEIFRHLGADISFTGDTVTVNPAKINRQDIPYELASKMRASTWAVGPLVAKYGKCSVALPGGCAIGARPIDLHIEALEKLGATTQLEDGNLIVTAPDSGRLVGAKIAFPFVTVGATVTAVCAAVLADGITIIDNAAREPEVVDVCNFLVALGAKIKHIGTSHLKITGVEKLSSCDYRVIADRIEAGTYLVGGACSRSRVACKGTVPSHMEAVLLKLEECGAEIRYFDRSGKPLEYEQVFTEHATDVTIVLDMHGQRPQPVNIITQPFPGIPTDIQAQFTLLNCLADGESTICETIFENRFMHVPELIRMGAHISQKGNTITINGVEQLSGARVKATDLRASISLVIAGCLAKGSTIVDEIYHIDRGYERIENRLLDLNVKIERKQA